MRRRSSAIPRSPSTSSLPVATAAIDRPTDRGIAVKPARPGADAAAVIGDPALPIIIELIGGYEPARRFVLAAIRAGKDVVTANKALLAVHGQEIAASSALL